MTTTPLTLAPDDIAHIQAAAARRNAAVRDAAASQTVLTDARRRRRAATRILTAALSEAHMQGATARTLAPLAGLSFQRVHQLVTATP